MVASSFLHWQDGDGVERLTVSIYNKDGEDTVVVPRESQKKIRRQGEIIILMMIKFMNVRKHIQNTLQNNSLIFYS